MANIVTGIIAIALVMATALSLTWAALSSASDISLTWDQLVDRTGDRARTQLALVTADIQGGGADIDISLQNTGQTALADFSDWDVILVYYATSTNQNLRLVRLAHTTSTIPASGQWNDNGFFLDVAASEAEVYEPNIFNPGEVMKMRLNITPSIPATTTNVATIGTANGVTLAVPFSR